MNKKKIALVGIIFLGVTTFFWKYLMSTPTESVLPIEEILLTWCELISNDYKLVQVNKPPEWVLLKNNFYKKSERKASVSTTEIYPNLDALGKPIKINIDEKTISLSFMEKTIVSKKEKITYPKFSPDKERFLFFASSPTTELDSSGDNVIGILYLYEVFDQKLKILKSDALITRYDWKNPRSDLFFYSQGPELMLHDLNSNVTLKIIQSKKGFSIFYPVSKEFYSQIICNDSGTEVFLKYYPNFWKQEFLYYILEIPQG